METVEAQNSPEWLSAWLDLQNELVQLFYWWAKPEEGRPIVEHARPLMEEHGTPRQRAQFYSVTSLQRFLANGAMVDDSILADFQAERAAVVEGGLQDERYSTWFQLGFALLWHGDLDAARVELEDSLQIARRTGDKTLELRVLTYLALTALRKHDLATVDRLAPELEEMANALGFGEYVGAALAMKAWGAWEKRLPKDAERLGQEALDQWERSAFYPVHWPCLWPLIAVRLADGRLAEAIEAARAMMAPRLQRIPKIEPTLLAALAAWDECKLDEAAAKLAEAVELARELRYA